MAKRKGKQQPERPVDLTDYSSEDVLKLMSRRKRRCIRVPREVSRALRKGDARLKQDWSLTAFLSQARILDNQEGGILGDRPAEVYVVSLAFDMPDCRAEKF